MQTRVRRQADGSLAVGAAPSRRPRKPETGYRPADSMRIEGGNMATSTSVPAWDTVALAKQLQTIASQSQTLMQSFLSQQQNWGQIGMGDASAIGGPFVDLMSKMAADPASVARAQVDLFNDSIVLWQKTAERMLLGRGSEPSPGKSDKRFK